MITLYHAQYTRSLRVRWLLEELGFEYEIERINFREKEHKGEAYMAVHPLGRMPAAVIDGLTMFESGAILQHVLDKFGEGRLHPIAGTPESATYLQWFHFGEATHQPYLSQIAQHTALLPKEERVPAVVEAARAGAAECLKLLDTHLSEHEYVAGNEFTAADIMVIYPLVLSHLFGMLPSDDFPHLMKYYERISERAAFQTATAD